MAFLPFLAGAADVNITNITKAATVTTNDYVLGTTGLVTRLLPVSGIAALSASSLPSVFTNPVVDFGSSYSSRLEFTNSGDWAYMQFTPVDLPQRRQGLFFSGLTAGDSGIWYWPNHGGDGMTSPEMLLTSRGSMAFSAGNLSGGVSGGSRAFQFGIGGAWHNFLYMQYDGYGNTNFVGSSTNLGTSIPILFHPLVYSNTVQLIAGSGQPYGSTIMPGFHARATDTNGSGAISFYDGIDTGYNTWGQNADPRLDIRLSPVDTNGGITVRGTVLAVGDGSGFVGDGSGLTNVSFPPILTNPVVDFGSSYGSRLEFTNSGDFSYMTFTTPDLPQRRQGLFFSGLNAAESGMWYWPNHGGNGMTSPELLITSRGTMAFSAGNLNGGVSGGSRGFQFGIGGAWHNFMYMQYDGYGNANFVGSSTNLGTTVPILFHPLCYSNEVQVVAGSGELYGLNIMPGMLARATDTNGSGAISFYDRIDVNYDNWGLGSSPRMDIRISPQETNGGITVRGTVVATGDGSGFIGDGAGLTNLNMTIRSNAQFAVTGSDLRLWNSNGLSLWMITATSTNFLGGTEP